MIAGDRSLAADDLREQAAACRRLALRASTSNGLAALSAVAGMLDADARRLDPSSEKRS